MRKQYIKVPIPEAISEDGGASILFVNKQTVPLDGAITDALAGNYCTGQKTLIRNFFFGIMQSMADGVRRDGHARQIANFLTVYPVFKGEIDLERGYDPEVNGVMIRARLLNEMDLDITDWSFEDVTEGKRSFKLDSVKAGPVIGEYLIGETGNLNGKDLPSTEAGETLRVHWAVEGTDMSGDIPAEKLSSDVGRADIAADALAELASEEYDGKTVVFTVRGNFSSAKISAKLKYAPAPKNRIAITWTEGGANTELGKTYINIEGENFDGVRDYETGGESDCTFSGKVTPEGGSPADVTFSGAVGGSLMIATLDSVLEVGTKYTVELEPDPAKTDFDPAHAVAEGEVAEA